MWFARQFGFAQSRKMQRRSRHSSCAHMVWMAVSLVRNKQGFWFEITNDLCQLESENF